MTACSVKRSDAFFICSYSIKRRTSSARGSRSSSSSCDPGRGNNILDLISVNTAAMSKYSAASSKLSAFMLSTYAIYCAVNSAIGMSKTSRFSFLIKKSKRSRGPSNDSSIICKASGGIYRFVGISTIASPRNTPICSTVFGATAKSLGFIHVRTINTICCVLWTKKPYISYIFSEKLLRKTIIRIPDHHF